MRNISSAFRRALYDGNRNYQCTAYITLVDDTELEITNARIAQGGVSLDDNVSDTSSFTALGSAIINALNLQINNVYEEYSGYDFTGASVILYISLTGVQDSPIKICTMTVEKARYNGMIITLECLDNMVNFDKPYTSSLTYPATLQNIVSTACIDCGVILGTTTFPNYTLEIPTRPNDEALTYREVISYVATLAGCFARCNSNGSLELKWFDKNALIAIEDTINGGIFDEDSPYSTGDTVNGGVFNPWNTGDEEDGGEFTDSINAHYITALSSQNLGIDDVVITGIQITIQNSAEPSPESEDEEESTTESEDETEEEEEEPTTDIITRTYGTSDYVLKIENNPFITIDNIDTIGTFLQTNIVGLTFRYGTISHLNDPSIEAGDVAMVWDRKGNAYPLLITNTQFSVGSYQNTTCSADTPTKNSATRFSALTKSFVENKEIVRKESNALETRLNQAIDAKAGMYETREAVGTSGAYIYYLHDKPNLSESSAVIKITNEAVGVTPDYQASPIQWYGLTVDGNFIANIMSVIGINFDWGTGGTLTLGGANNQNGVLTVLDASGNTIGTWNNTGLKVISEDEQSSFQVDAHGVSMFDKIGNSFFDFSTDGSYTTKGNYGTAYLGKTSTFSEQVELPADINPLSSMTLQTSALTWGEVMVAFIKDGSYELIYPPYRTGASSFYYGTPATSLYNSNPYYVNGNYYIFYFKFNYDGETTITMNVYCKKYSDSSDVSSIEGLREVHVYLTNAVYYKDVVNPAFTIGTRTKGESVVLGAYSTTIGDGLKASYNYQTVIGKYNKNLYAAFEIGNGTSDSSRSNAMTVDWDGNLTLKGHDSEIGYIPAQASGSDIAITGANTWVTVCSITLSAGVWLIYGKLQYPVANPQTSTYVRLGIKVSTDTTEDISEQRASIANAQTMVKSFRILNLTSTKTIQLRASAGVARTCSGWLSAVRIQ